MRLSGFGQDSRTADMVTANFRTAETTTYCCHFTFDTLVSV